MIRRTWFLYVSLTLVLLLAAAGCTHKPAYSDIDTNINRNASSSQAASGQPDPVAAPQVTPTAPAAEAPGTPAKPATTKPPTFLDAAAGGIKDLPSYPRAYRMNVQVGPMQGFNTMSIALRTSDPMDKIASFYEQTIKANNWTVTDKITDPELSEWTLTKAAENTGKVQVRKDPKTGTMNIILVRAEKIAESSK